MPASLHRCLAVWTAASTAAALAIAWLLPIALDPAAGLDRVLVRACAAVATLAVGWLWAATAATAVAAVRGREAPARGVPAPVRRLVLAACGVALTGGLAAGAAHANPGPTHPGGSSGQPAAVAGLPVPDRALSAPEIVVVAPGDSLWSIAQRHLGAGASEAEIDAEWRRLYARNRDLIGPDPDLVQPAQRLRLPISEVLP